MFQGSKTASAHGILKDGAEPEDAFIDFSTAMIGLIAELRLGGVRPPIGRNIGWELTLTWTELVDETV